MHLTTYASRALCVCVRGGGYTSPSEERVVTVKKGCEILVLSHFRIY